MPTFNRDALRKGSAAIDAALESRKNGGDFRPFLPNIFWKNDKDFRYLLFLNPLEEIPELAFHPYIDCDDGVPHMTIARTDPCVGGAVADPIQEQWGYKPRLTGLAVAVELEPMIEMVNSRPKPVGFEVKTVEFERRIRDDAGELTEERETVQAPVVGLVAQSPFNFFNQLRSFDATEASIHTTPVKVTRLGKKENVTYNIVGYDTVELNLDGLLDNIENLSYVQDAEVVLEGIAKATTNDEATVAVGDYILYRRLEELADEDGYNSILHSITKPAKFQDEKTDKTERKAKPSQRRTKDDSEDAEEPKARSRKPEEKVTKESPASARLENLRNRSKQSKKTTE